MDIVKRLREKADRKSPNLYILEQRIETEAADEIERLREALREINKRNPFHNATPPMDKQQYAQIIVEMVGIANDALKEGE